MRSELARYLNLEVESGYPFAEIRTDTIFYADRLVLKATVDSGPFVSFGEILNQGDAHFKSGFLHRYFRIRKGQPFSLQRQRQIFALASQMDFAQNIESPRLEFFGNQAIVHLSLMKSRNNQFSGLIGLLPGGNSGKTILVGNADISLVNLFGIGMGGKLFWNRFATNSQSAFVNLQIPSLNFSGLGLQIAFELFRQDTTLNKQRFESQLRFPNPQKFTYSVGIFANQSNGIFSREQTQATRTRLQGLSLGLSNPADPHSKISLVNKSWISLINLSQKLVTTGNNPTRELFQAEAKLDFYRPIWVYKNRFAVQTRTYLSWIESPLISLQDQARFGGASSIRGFLENEFFVTRGGFFTLQPQFLLDSRTLLGLFSDFFVLDRSLKSAQKAKLSTGTGLGFCFEMALPEGILRLALANGLVSDQPFDWQTTKIHFGYSARF